MNDEVGGTEESGSDPSGGAGRMWGLLQDLLEAHGRNGTAKLLGVSERTLRRAESNRHVTPQLQKELERHANASLGDGPSPQSRELAVQLASLATLKSRFDGLERGTRESLDGLRQEVAELAAANEALSKRVDELQQGGAGRSDRVERMPTGADGDNPGPSATSHPALDRRYPQLVTEVAEAGEQAVYRDAMPLITEWRAQRSEFLNLNLPSGWGRLTAEVRMTELEIELIEQYELTLPPSDYPWDGIRRHSELRRRRRTLERLRRERRRAWARRWLLRLFTLRWRGR